MPNPTKRRGKGVEAVEAVEARFQVWQGGVLVACGSGPRSDCAREANHYACVYAQDGPVRVRIEPIPRKPAKRRTK